MKLPAKLLALLLLISAGGVGAVEWDTGGDLRYYQFLTLENLPGQREHSEFGVLRLKARHDRSG